jgi:hypothetical protein
MEVGFGRMMSKRVIYVQTNQGLLVSIINCRTDSNPHIIHTLSKYVIKNKKVVESTSKKDKKTGKKAILPTKSIMLSWITRRTTRARTGKMGGDTKGQE